LITGAASGIGRAFADRFVQEGAIVAVADIDEKGAISAAESLGHRVSAHRVDIGDLGSTRRAVEEVVNTWGRVDVLINNASLYRGIDLVNTTEEYLGKVLQINLVGAWRMTSSVVGTMTKQGSGKVINIGSDAAYGYYTHPMIGDELPNFSYALSKWGVHGLTKYMAYVLGPKGINVNCISPGMTLTQATIEVVPDDLIKQTESTVPLRRSVQPEEIAGTAVFLSSSDADLITGQIICVDAGMFMPA
jgi:3-oxoacyl-[acyl-carrier protein] reductase